MGNRKYIFVALIALILTYIIWDSGTQPGAQDLAGDFKEVAFYRNEQNTGPVVRIYSVTVTDTLWQEMEQFGNYKPHTKYGNTKVFFFLEQDSAPKKLYPEDGNFDPGFRNNCIGMYEKDAMSQVKLVKFPYRD